MQYVCKLLHSLNLNVSLAFEFVQLPVFLEPIGLISVTAVRIYVGSCDLRFYTMFGRVFWMGSMMTCLSSHFAWLEESRKSSQRQRRFLRRQQHDRNSLLSIFSTFEDAAGASCIQQIAILKW